MGVCRSRGVGQYAAGETHNFAWGRSSVPGVAKGVIFLQGSHSLSDELFASEAARAQALAEAGFTCVSGDLSQTVTQGTFGNDTARTRVGQLVSLLQSASAPCRAAAGKVRLVGTSGGATAAINYALQNPSNVASMYLMTPLVDLQDFHDNRTAPAFTPAEVETAYGGAAAFTAALATHSPVASNLSALAGIPIRIAYSTNDQYISTSSVAAFAAATGASSYSLGPVLHNPATVDPKDVVSFFQV